MAAPPPTSIGRHERSACAFRAEAGWLWRAAPLPPPQHLLPLVSFQRSFPANGKGILFRQGLALNPLQDPRVGLDEGTPALRSSRLASNQQEKAPSRRVGARRGKAAFQPDPAAGRERGWPRRGGGSRTVRAEKSRGGSATPAKEPHQKESGVTTAFRIRRSSGGRREQPRGRLRGGRWAEAAGRAGESSPAAARRSRGTSGQRRPQSGLDGPAVFLEARRWEAPPPTSLARARVGRGREQPGPSSGAVPVRELPGLGSLAGGPAEQPSPPSAWHPPRGSQRPRAASRSHVGLDSGRGPPTSPSRGPPAGAPPRPFPKRPRGHGPPVEADAPLPLLGRGGGARPPALSAAAWRGGEEIELRGFELGVPGALNFLRPPSWRRVGEAFVSAVTSLIARRRPRRGVNKHLARFAKRQSEDALCIPIG